MTRTIVSALLAGALVAPGVAQAQSRCSDPDTVRVTILEQYAETARYAGVLPSGTQVMLIYVSADGSTFTVVVVDPARSIACVAAGGTGFLDVPQPVAGDPS